MDIESIATKLETLCSYALYMKQGQEPAIFRSNHALFSAASLIKAPMLLAWLFLESRGELSSDEICDLDGEPAVYGAGFAHLLRTRSLAFADVLLMMMATSDNLCANLVIQRAGMERLNHIFRDEFDLPGTTLRRKFMDFDARSRGLENTISAGDCIGLYEVIERIDALARKRFERYLHQCQDFNLLLRDIPRDSAVFYHKTGSLNGVLHDWGFTQDTKLFLLTQDVKDEIEVTRLFGECGRAALIR